MYQDKNLSLDSALVDTVERGEELLLRAQIVGGQSMYDLVEALLGPQEDSAESRQSVPDEGAPKLAR